ncbi:DUF6199 family natural product biosynthesis protein [Streptomyces sp. enrichment culture]|uniref:DUF6199 family natural product biosynthesis protein n=1 Tax=Streptomyces sp. enrichment culture TaxID=1795815 RepID=UPI003F54AAC1
MEDGTRDNAYGFAQRVRGNRTLMSHDVMVQAASNGDGGSPVVVLLLCFFLIMGVVQVVRPQLLWKANSRLQQGWVRNPEATEPTGKGYAMNRMVGVIFLGFVIWMLVQQF